MLSAYYAGNVIMLGVPARKATLASIGELAKFATE